MRYADLNVGLIIQGGSYLVEAEEIMAFARQWDPQPFRTNEAMAACTKWQGLIASGWHTCGIAMRLAVQAVLHDSSSSGSPGLESLRWPHPVRAGDQLALTIEVVELRRSKSNEYGLARWKWTLRNQHEQIVLDTALTSLFNMGAETREAAAS